MMLGGYLKIHDAEESAVSAAHLLCQSAEAALLKQKKNLAISQFRHAKVAQKRWKAHHKEDATAELPQDVLAHFFNFLDTQSLALVGKVCWSWNVAANNNLLWQAHYAEVFGSSSDSIGPKAKKSTLFIQENVSVEEPVLIGKRHLKERTVAIALN